jgi:pimeloyl-ACP methyl ester carboxylesterase
MPTRLPTTLLALMAMCLATSLSAQTTARSLPSSSSGEIGSPAATAPTTVVLVHGAFADGSGWKRIIPLLERDGYNVIAVQNPLTSLADDIANTKRVIASQPGQVIVVGHSYGGAVITGAAAGSSRVKGLVYLAAFAPDANEPLGAYLEKYPSPLGKALRPDSGGYVYIDRAQFRDVFAPDVSAAEAHVMAVTQKPVNGATFGASLNSAAWKSIPAWYLVSQEDRVINPELSRFYAKRMNATTSEIKASHVAFISRPEQVARFISDAARAATAKP